MTPGWAFLLAAGVVEIAWAQSIPPTEGFTRLWPSLVCLVLCVGVIYLLALACRTVPVSTAYVVFTGIGAAGAVLLGLTVHNDPITPARLAAVLLIIGGVLLAHTAATA
jgi:quaternary ammonium compound-resistance protein SugE